MDWADSPEQAAFRQEVQTLIGEKLPTRYRQQPGGGLESMMGTWQSDRKSDDPEANSAAIEWASALAERGWIAPHWPTAWPPASLRAKPSTLRRR